MEKKMTLIQYFTKCSPAIAVAGTILAVVLVVATLAENYVERRCVSADFSLNAAQLCGMDKLCIMNPSAYEKWMRDWTYIKESCPNEWEASKEFTPNTRSGETNRRYGVRPRTEDQTGRFSLLRLPSTEESRDELLPSDETPVY